MSFTRNSWIPLPRAPHGVMWNGDMTPLNDYEFVIAAECKSDGSSSGIYKYNALRDIWTPLIRYRYNFESLNHSIAFDTDTQTVYFSGSSSQIQSISLSQSSSSKSASDCRPPATTHTPSIQFPCMLYIDGTVHILGALNYHKHAVYSPHTHCLREIHDFQSLSRTHSPQTIIAQIGFSTAVHCKSRDQIVLIKGELDATANVSASGVVSKIWTYSLRDRVWRLVHDIAIPYWNVNAVLSSDERYLIITGGCDANGMLSDGIYVLNMSHPCPLRFQLCVSYLQCPRRHRHFLLRTGGVRDECLVFGYVKALFGTKEYRKMQRPSIYIMQLIAGFFAIEMVHWLEKNGEGDAHFAMPMKRILASIQR